MPGRRRRTADATEKASTEQNSTATETPRQMSYLIAAICGLVFVGSLRMRGYSHAALSLAVGLVFGLSKAAFDYWLPPADALGHSWYAYCIYGEVAIILGALIAATKSPASAIAAVLSMVAIWANLAAAEDYIAGGGPAWDRYRLVILAIQSGQLATVVLFSPPAVSAILWTVDRIEKRESGRWQARVAQ